MAELYQGKFSGEEIDSRLDNAKRTCRGWTEADCDYLCDGTADDVEINAAIQALPETGGEILILDGTYKITAPITVNKNGATLRGNGTATILQRNWNSSVEEGVINITAANGGITVQNIQINGKIYNYTDTKNYGIYITSGSNNIVNNICSNNYSCGIFSGSDNNTIIGNTCNNNKSKGIELYGSGNIVTGNICNDNYKYGIASSSPGNTITGNTCNNNSNGIFSDSGNNTITGNTCNNNSDGIRLFHSDKNTVTGNTCNNNNTGISLFSSDNNTVTGNTCIRGTGQASDYTSSQRTIYVDSASKNLIVGNNIMGKNYEDGGTNNTWANNKYN